MEDYNSNLLNDSKNEWSIRLMNILCGHVIDGFRSIFNESIKVCEENEEPEKYLMTFQNFLSRIPKWNQNIIDTECGRIKESTKCDYLDDLITCVHVIQLKILSCVRTSNQCKKIDIDIPKFNQFLHNVYINIARKLYSNIYLFQVDITPLEQQKNNREFENIVQISIMNTIRDNIPIDTLLKQYIDETQDVDVEEKIIQKENITHEINNNESAIDSSNNNESSILLDSSSNNETAIENVSFNNTIDKFDPVNNEVVKENINFESKPEPTYLGDDDDDDNDEKITIGEPITLNIDDDNTKENKPSNEMVPIDLNTLSFDEPTNDVKNEIIDLGIEEIKL